MLTRKVSGEGSSGLMNDRFPALSSQKKNETGWASGVNSQWGTLCLNLVIF